MIDRASLKAPAREAGGAQDDSGLAIAIRAGAEQTGGRFALVEIAARRGAEPPATGMRGRTS